MQTDERASIVIGITGHRPNRLRIGAVRLRRKLVSVLQAVRRAERRCARRAGQLSRQLAALTALAEGADRELAEAALELGIAMHVLLPFRSPDYETTFSDVADTPRYRALLAKAAQVTELPGGLDATKAAYEAVGQATAERSQLVIAVWDGKPAAGRGGTPEIIEHALQRGVPVVWIDATTDRRPRLLRMPTAQGPRDVPLDRIARRAKPIAWRRIGALLAAG